jgi:steroid delta-isomerase-like uncharacterized protein
MTGTQRRDSSEDNRAVARRFGEAVWGRGDMEAADAVLAEDFVEHNPAPGQGPGREGHKQVLEQWRAAFPDLTLTNEDVVAEGDKVALRWTARGTHKGPLMGLPPTDHEVTLTGIDILRIADGRIVERWGEFNGLEMLQQLGVLPPVQGAG